MASVEKMKKAIEKHLYGRYTAFNQSHWPRAQGPTFGILSVVHQPANLTRTEILESGYISVLIVQPAYGYQILE